MTSLGATIIIDGACDAPALVTRQPINFPAALCKAPNLLPWKRGEVRDRGHEWFGKNIVGKALVFPACVGSTYTGLVLLEIISLGRGPAALVVQTADPLLLSGVILSEVWFDKSIPVLEHPGAHLFDEISTGDRIRIELGAGKLLVQQAVSSRSDHSQAE